MDEIVFSYNKVRCHAHRENKLSENEIYVGTINNYDIYQIPNVT